MTREQFRQEVFARDNGRCVIHTAQKNAAAWFLVGITTTGIGPRSTTPDSKTVIVRVGGRGGRGGAGGPTNASAGGKHPGGNRWAALRSPERTAAAAVLGTSRQYSRTC